MLILQRRIGDRIVVEGGIEITVTEITRRGVRLAVSAPPGITILRGETHDAIVASNKLAAQSVGTDFEIVLAVFRRHVRREDFGVGAADEFLLGGAAAALDEMAVAKHDFALGVLGKKECPREMLEELPQAVWAHVTQPLEVSGVGHRHH